MAFDEYAFLLCAVHTGNTQLGHHSASKLLNPTTVWLSYENSLTAAGYSADSNGLAFPVAYPIRT